jgi:glycosyltransferase involved in cell wall biosynthesis
MVEPSHQVNTQPSVVTINQRDYHVAPHEFNIYPSFTTLKTRAGVRELEREIALIDQLAACFNTSESQNGVTVHHNVHLISVGLSHGGFVELNVTDEFNSYSVLTEDQQQMEYLRLNAASHLDGNKLIYFNNEQSANPNDVYIIRKVDGVALTVMDSMKAIILSREELQLNTHQLIYLSDSNLRIYIQWDCLIPFTSWFQLELQKNVLYYDNLIHLSMIVKDAGPNFEDVLRHNLPYIDSWTILDTGSTDGTIETIKKVMKNKRGDLFQEPFINFRDSRNRALDLVRGKHKFILILDDTYCLNGGSKDKTLGPTQVRNFLRLAADDETADSYNIFIKSKTGTIDAKIYGSNRIIKMNRRISISENLNHAPLRYVHLLHETIIPNHTVQIPLEVMYLDDLDSDYMNERTRARKKLDLFQLLSMYEDDPDDSRTLYYLAGTCMDLGLTKWAIEFYRKRIDHPNKGYKEEIVDSYMMIAVLQHKAGLPWEKCEQLYLDCYHCDEKRADALYSIGYYYYFYGMYDKAYPYMVQGFKLGVPLESTSDLRYFIYNEKLPYYVAKLAIDHEDYVIGREACLVYLDYMENPDPEISLLYRMYEELIGQQLYSKTRNEN